MTPEQCQMVVDLRDPPSPHDDDWEMLDDILYGDEALDISHVGGELEALTERHGHDCERYGHPFLNINII